MRILGVCFILLVSVIAACGPADTSNEGPDEVDVTITLDNEGASAWLITAVTAEDVAQTDVPNPTWTLEPGKRYRIVNNGGAAHPFALRDSRDQDLLSQETGQTGSVEADAAINYLEDDGGVTFTFTGALAAADGVYYICTFHPSMRGAIDIAP